MRLHYKGHVDPQIGTLIGPSMDGRYFRVAGTIYDKTKNISEVWLDADE